MQGKYVLFRTDKKADGKQWTLHRMDPPGDPTRAPVPTDLGPMLAVPTTALPHDDDRWAFEMKWDGMRALLTVDGGRRRATSRQGNDATGRFPELQGLGRATTGLPYSDRRRLRERLALAGPAWQTPPATVGGWLPGKAGLTGRLGSLLVGYYDDDHVLRFAGRVGSGISGATRDDLEARLAKITQRSSPFADVPALPDPHWVTPKLVVEMAFHEWTSAGVLRAPRYKGLRTDKDAREVTREP